MDLDLPHAMANKLPLILPGIRAKLETARVARLATLDAERKPHVVSICFLSHLGLGSPVSRQVLQVDHGLLAHPDESGAWPVEIDD